MRKSGNCLEAASTAFSCFCQIEVALTIGGCSCDVVLPDEGWYMHENEQCCLLELHEYYYSF